MTLTNMIIIDKKLKMIESQGHKVKVQGQICNFVKILVYTVYHEPMIKYL